MALPTHRRTVALRDGARITLRQLTRDDQQRLAASFARLSEESRHRRFFGTKSELSETDLD